MIGPYRRRPVVNRTVHNMADAIPNHLGGARMSLSMSDVKVVKVFLCLSGVSVNILQAALWW